MCKNMQKLKELEQMVTDLSKHVQAVAQRVADLEEQMFKLRDKKAGDWPLSL